MRSRAAQSPSGKRKKAAPRLRRQEETEGRQGGAWGEGGARQEGQQGPPAPLPASPPAPSGAEPARGPPPRCWLEPSAQPSLPLCAHCPDAARALRLRDGGPRAPEPSVPMHPGSAFPCHVRKASA